ncbi:MAG: hypothetical protein QGH72_03885, partial [Dehalococcoidia bacterium]|nr:hypothetical protein [Dehalococcoidia bacterium]
MAVSTYVLGDPKGDAGEHDDQCQNYGFRQQVGDCTTDHFTKGDPISVSYALDNEEDLSYWRS